jgi:hypothetical protein
VAPPAVSRRIATTQPALSVRQIVEDHHDRHARTLASRMPPDA